MKRSSLKRGKPPVRRTELRRTGFRRRRSEKRKAEGALARQVTAAAFERDLGCLLARRSDVAGRCWGSLRTPHHLRKRSAGGEWSLDNIVTACSVHQVWIEDNPNAAHALGLVVRHGESTADAWRRMAAAGLVPEVRS